MRDVEKKVLLLRLRKSRRTFGILASIKGPLVQKGRRGSGRATVTLQDTYRNEAAKWQWTFAPRAGISVRFDFSSTVRNCPHIDKLVKFYLDPMQGILFQDDRQVRCISATLWRPPMLSVHSGASEELAKMIKVVKSEGSPADSSVHIKVERLQSYKDRFDLFFEADRVMSESTFDDHRRRRDDDTDREPEAWLFYLDPENIRRLKLPAGHR